MLLGTCCISFSRIYILWKFWGRVGLHFVQILSVWPNWFDFKPNIIIINHQFEISGTRVEYMDREKRAYKHEIWSYRICAKTLIITHTCVSRGTRCLKVVGSPLQLVYFVYAGIESPGEVMRTCRLVGAFPTRRCYKNFRHTPML